LIIGGIGLREVFCVIRNNKYLFIGLLFSLLLLPVINYAQSPTVKPITYTQFTNLINNTKGSVGFLCIYSSTCPACNKQMPIVNYVGQVYGRKGVTMIVLSLDDSSQELAEYLNGNQLFFEPLWLSRKTGGMAAVLKPYGCSYQSRIPYTVVIDGSGRAIREWTGVTDYNNFAYWIEKALESVEQEAETLPPSQWEFIGSDK
jgi:thiol-disulfide isomerase/thioredoxin